MTEARLGRAVIVSQTVQGLIIGLIPVMTVYTLLIILRLQINIVKIKDIPVLLR